MIPRSLAEFLGNARVPYNTLHHRAAFSAQREAAASHVPGRCWAKTVVCFADEEPILAVLPACLMVDLPQLRLLAGAKTLRLAREQEIVDLYPDCEPGAMPPFGSLYLQRVFLDQGLVGEPEMVFNGGTHMDAICMHYRDFIDVARAIVGPFASAAGMEAQA